MLLTLLLVDFDVRDVCFRVDRRFLFFDLKRTVFGR